MDLAQFERLASQSRMKAVARSVAQAVLVDGCSYAEAASVYGKGRQFAYQVCRRLIDSEAAGDRVYVYEAAPSVLTKIDCIVVRHRGRKMLTEAQFYAAASRSRLYPHSLRIARELLVDGQEILALARRHRVSRHLVWQAGQRLMKRSLLADQAVRAYKGSVAMFAEIDALLQLGVH